VTSILHCHWWEFWSRDAEVFIILSIISIKNKKLPNSNNNRSKPKLHRLLWDIVVFKLVAYISWIWYVKTYYFFKNFIFIDFHVNLTQFFVSISRDRNIRYNSHGYRSTSQMLGFSLYPLSFSCTVPLSIARSTSFSIVFWLSLLI